MTTTTTNQDALTAAIAAGPFMSTRYGWAGPFGTNNGTPPNWITVHVWSDAQRCFYGHGREAVAALALDYYRTWSK